MTTKTNKCKKQDKVRIKFEGIGYDGEWTITEVHDHGHGVYSYDIINERGDTTMTMLGKDIIKSTKKTK